MYLGENIRNLGFGLMRLPQKDGVIEIEQVKIMVDKFSRDGLHFSRYGVGVSGQRGRDPVIQLLRAVL